MSRSSIVVNTTDRVFTFRPVAGPNPMISQYMDPSKGSAVLFDRLGIELRPAAPSNDGTRVTHRLNFPVPAVVADGNAAGYVSAPKAVGENRAILALSISKFSTQVETLEFAEAVIAYVALPEFKQILLDQLTPQ